MTDLFDWLAEVTPPASEPLAEGAVCLRGFAVAAARGIVTCISTVVSAAPFRRMTTRGGFRMSVEITNCGALGWITDHRGYRYQATDPVSGSSWPAMPTAFMELATRAAASAGYAGFIPDACLINRYAPGARMTLHQDTTERSLLHPIVSVSLGCPATFQFGGATRVGPIRRVMLRHGDVVVWGGASRLAHHGILPLKEGVHPATGACRINLTFRRAG